VSDAARRPERKIAVHLENGRAQFVRVAALDRPPLVFFIDGVRAEARAGDTILTAILANRRHIRAFEFTDERRAGFCLMGACQDCWVQAADGAPLRACTTLVAPGMEIVTVSAPSASWHQDD
jgi:predicted molibdopterin-dependent oxidoreductase YjgC